jgi:hypothetical protein
MAMTQKTILRRTPSYTPTKNPISKATDQKEQNDDQERKQKEYTETNKTR